MMHESDQHLRPMRHGFTLVELLVVIAIIALLVGMLLVGINKVRSKGEQTNTEQLMRSMDIGLSAFKEDHGFYPPLLDDTVSPQATNDLYPYPNDRARDLDYYSTLSLAPYLLGVGDLNGDGNVDDDYDDGLAGLGMRTPTADRSWGYTYRGQSGTGRRAYWQAQEKDVNGEDVVTGQTYGPYIEVDADGQLGFAHNRAGDKLDSPARYAILDYWGRPIRYYRFWEQDLDPQRNVELEDLVPEWFASLQASDVESFRVRVRSSGYVLMSEGEDRKAMKDEIEAKENADNMVRVQS